MYLLNTFVNLENVYIWVVIALIFLAVFLWFLLKLFIILFFSGKIFRRGMFLNKTLGKNDAQNTGKVTNKLRRKI